MLTHLRKYKAGSIDSSVSNVKVQSLDKDTYAFVVSAPTSPDGSLFNSEKAPKTHTTGRVYSTLFVRHWDTWGTPQRNSLWYGTLSATSRNSTSGNKYALSKLTNALDNPDLESPVQPFGGTDHFDLSTSGIAFVSKDPELNPATHTKQNLYILPRTNSSGFTLDKSIKVTITGFEGATTNPTFSPDGKSLTFTSMREDGYESDKNQLFIIPDIKRPQWIEYFFTSKNGKGRWDKSPSAIAWSKDGKTLYLQAEEHGRGAIFSTPSNTMAAQSLPAKIFTGGSPSGYKVLSNGELFISRTSLIDNSVFYLLDASSEASIASGPKLISSNSKEGSAFGLSRNQVDEIWYDGEEVKNHAWVIKPSNFKKGEKYPLAFLIHGGPQGAWEDSWSTRWNPAVFAEQGYVVVAPVSYPLHQINFQLTALAEPNRLNRLRPRLDRRNPRPMGWAPIQRPRQSIRIHRIRTRLRRHLPCRRPRRLLRRLHGKLDPRPTPRSQIQSASNPRWRLQYDRTARI
jgi:dipeptidyl aminopeptidase/acylaminoacyl peptidase